MIKREKPLEYSTLACRIISLLQLTLAQDTSSVFEISYSILMQRLKGSKSQVLIREILHCICTMAFICDTPDETLSEIMSCITTLLSTSKDNGVIETAISMWTLLSSVQPAYSILSDSLPSFGLSTEVMRRFVQLVLDRLTVNDMDVRIAAAKCLAFVNELVVAVSAHHPDHSQTPSYQSDKPITEIESSLSACLAEYNRYWKGSKDKDKKMILREVTRACSGSGHPDMHFMFKRSGVSEISIDLSHWSEVAHYEMLRDLLGHGFLFHIIVACVWRDVMRRGIRC